MEIRPIDANQLYRIEKLLDTDIVKKDKVASELLEQVLYDIQHMPTLTPPNEWVSVEERLPEHMKNVIVLYGSGEIDIDWVDSLGDFRFDNLFGRVTHWMPLPAPPGEDNNVPTNKPLTLEFDVVDTTTGKYPDWERITIEEPWANRLVDCDMDGIAIREDGSLILLDECGNCVSCPPDRFEIRRPPEGDADA